MAVGRQYNNLGPRIAVAGGFQIKNGIGFESGTGFPTSGTSGTTVRNAAGAPASTIYIDETTGTMFFNEGTVASPYWSPMGVNQRGIVGVMTDFSDLVGSAGTETTAFYYDKGVRFFGQGIEVNDVDTAVTISYPLGGPLATVGTTDEANHVMALGYGGTAGLWAPATNGVMVIDATFTGITDILTRAFFLGFSGDANGAMANEIDPVVTGATTTLTFSAVGTAGDNVHGLFMDSRLTAASTFFLATNKANAAATQTTADAALTVAATMPAAATYTRLRIEIDTAGNLRAFVNKVLVKTVLLAATPTKVLQPIFYQANSTTTAALKMGVRRFGTWAARA